MTERYDIAVIGELRIGPFALIEMVGHTVGVVVAEERLAQITHAVVIGGDAPRTPNCLAIAIPAWDGGMQVIALDLAGICISAGSACSSGKSTAPRPWTAIIGEDLARCGIRVSLGWNTTEADIDTFIAAWTREYARVAPRLKEIA